MAGGTHVFDMIKRMRGNESLRTFRYFSKRQTAKDFYPTHEPRVNGVLHAFRILFNIVVILGLVALLIFMGIKILS